MSRLRRLMEPDEEWDGGSTPSAEEARFDEPAQNRRRARTRDRGPNVGVAKLALFNSAIVAGLLTIAGLLTVGWGLEYFRSGSGASRRSQERETVSELRGLPEQEEPGDAVRPATGKATGRGSMS